MREMCRPWRLPPAVPAVRCKHHVVLARLQPAAAPTPSCLALGGNVTLRPDAQRISTAYEHGFPWGGNEGQQYKLNSFVKDVARFLLGSPVCGVPATQCPSGTAAAAGSTARAMLVWSQR